MRGSMSVRGLCVLKLKAVPHPKVLKRLPLNALLSDNLLHLLTTSDLVNKVDFVQERHVHNTLLLKLVWSKLCL